MPDFPNTIPVGEVADSDFGEFAAAVADECDLTDRELLLALLNEVQLLRQEVADLSKRVKS